MYCWRDNGTAFQSSENRKENTRLSVEQLRMSYLKYQPIGRPDSEFLGPHWECRPQKPASGFESWSFPNILVLNFFFATNKTMFRTNINALKPTMVLWSPVNRSRFLKTDVFVVWCWCGRGSSCLDGWHVSSSPKKGTKWWLFTHENQNPTTVILPSSNHWWYFGGVLSDLPDACLIHQVQSFKKNLTSYFSLFFSHLFYFDHFHKSANIEHMIFRGCKQFHRSADSTVSVVFSQLMNLGFSFFCYQVCCFIEYPLICILCVCLL